MNVWRFATYVPEYRALLISFNSVLSEMFIIMIFMAVSANKRTNEQRSEKHRSCQLSRGNSRRTRWLNVSKTDIAASRAWKYIWYDKTSQSDAYRIHSVSFLTFRSGKHTYLRAKMFIRWEQYVIFWPLPMAFVPALVPCCRLSILLSMIANDKWGGTCPFTLSI